MLIELHRSGVDAYSVSYKEPNESALARLGLAKPSRGGGFSRWARRVADAALGGPAPPALVAPSRTVLARDPGLSPPLPLS